MVYTIVMEIITNIKLDLDEHVSGITLNSGRQLTVWNGRPCYSSPDEFNGRLEIGARLIAETSADDGSKVFHFA